MDPPHVDRSATNLDVEIRFAGELDADAISLLLGDLGYSIEAARILEKLAALRHSPADRVWVAEAPSGVLGDAGEALAGLLSFHAIPLLHTPGNLGRITSLVVHPQLRGKESGDASSGSPNASRAKVNANGWSSRAASTGTMRTASTWRSGSLCDPRDSSRPWPARGSALHPSGQPDHRRRSRTRPEM